MSIQNNNNNRANKQSQSKVNGQQNYAHSNQRNPDNIRDNTRDHRYEDNFENTNDENYKSGKIKKGVDLDFTDKDQNDPQDARQ